MAELVFYTNPMSRGRIIRWMLEEVGQPYRTELLDFATTAKTPEFLAINPMGKVPTITHGDTVVTEAAAICLYLADAFPQAGLAPATTDPRRGTYYRWTLFAAGPIEQVMTNKTMGWIAPPERRAMVGYASFEEAIDAAETAVKTGPFILGDQFSAADVYFARPSAGACSSAPSTSVPSSRPTWSGSKAARPPSAPARSTTA
jgi:glutathione S-transferase